VFCQRLAGEGMKIKISILWVFLFFAMIGLRAGTVSLEPDEIINLRALIATNTDASARFEEIRRWADAALRDNPNPIQHVTTEGLLYKNPRKTRTLTALVDMPKISSLAWTFAGTGDERYSAKAREFILAWAKTNQSDGNAINETRFGPLIVSYDLIRQTFSNADRETVDNWLRDKAEMLWHDRQHNYDNNWFSHRLKIVGLIGYTIGDKTLIDETLEKFRAHINTNLHSDGSSYDFYQRDALHYHLYDIEPLLTLARVAGRNGQNLFDYRGTNGATLQSAVDFVVPFALGKKTHMEFVHSTVGFDYKRAKNGQTEYQPHLWNPDSAVVMFMQASWFRPDYGTLAARLAGHPGEKFFSWQMVINAVSSLSPK
jgi:Alginate lyase